METIKHISTRTIQATQRAILFYMTPAWLLLDFLERVSAPWKG